MKSPRARLAVILLGYEVDRRIPTVQELQQQLGVGAGTVMKAIRSLESDGAISLTSRGHLGTIVEQRRVGTLWNAAELGGFELVMPPPGAAEQRGLLEGIRASFAKRGIAVVPEFLPGAQQRMETVFHEQFHAAITSTGAFDERNGLPGLTQFGLGENTFYASGSLVVVRRRDDANPPGGERLRVGIDRRSRDHRVLTETIFDGDNYRFVDCTFVRVPAAVLERSIDAAVWHRIPTVIPPELAGLSLTPIDAEVLKRAYSASNASIVSVAANTAVNALIRELDLDELRRHQQRELDAVHDYTGLNATWYH